MEIVNLDRQLRNSSQLCMRTGCSSVVALDGEPYLKDRCCGEFSPPPSDQLPATIAMEPEFVEICEDDPVEKLLTLVWHSVLV